MTNSAPEIKAKFDTPDFVENNEEMLKEEFTKYFQVMSFLRLRVCSIFRFKKKHLNIWNLNWFSHVASFI